MKVPAVAPGLYGHLVFSFDKAPNGVDLIVTTHCKCCGRELTRRELDMSTSFRETDYNAREDGVIAIEHVKHCTKVPRETLQ